MQTNQARAIKTSNRHIRRKYVSVILVVSCFFAGSVRAQETQSSTLTGVNDILQSFISIMSRWRVVLAALAGKMMTNDRVFGAALHMDVYLRKIWNIMKNFANFALIAFLLGSLIKNLLDKKDLQIKSLITKTLIAGILIQASRFMMWALIDVSTVAVTAVSSFPMSFMWENTQFNTQMKAQAEIIRTTTINVNNASPQKISIENSANDNSPNPMSNDDILQTLMPNANSMWGPLIFLWASVFRFYEYMGQNSQSTTQVLAVNFSLKMIVLVIYTIALLLLLIANIVRVAFLRIFIIASPFIILFKVFKDDKMSKDSKGITKYLSLSGLMDLVFKPVIFMAMMSLILILVVSIQNIMLSQSTIDLNGVSMSVAPNTKTATLAVQWVSSVTINDNLFASLGSTSKSIFADLILFFLTIFLMRELIKRSLTSGSGPIQDVMKPATKFIEDFTKTAPIFWGQSFNAIKSMKKETTSKYAEGMGLDANRKSGRFSAAEKEFQSNLQRSLWLNAAWVKKDFDELDQAINSGDENEFRRLSRSKAQEIENGLSMNVSNGDWKKRLEKRFDKYRSTINTSTWWWSDYTTFDEFLGKWDKDNSATKKNRWKLHELMGGNDVSRIKRNKDTPPTYDELMSNVYFSGSLK